MVFVVATVSAPMEPLHLPERRRADRRTGRSSARLYDALSTPTGDRAGWRPPSEKRTALRRLLARRRPPTLRVWLAAVGFAVVALTALVARDGGALDELRPLAEAPGDYARLATLAAAACEADRCSYGLEFGTDPPPALRPLMARLRVRTVVHEPPYGETLLKGGLTATSALRFDHPAGPDVAAIRDRRAAWEADVDRADADRSEYRTYTPPEPLGGGWWRVAPR